MITRTETQPEAQPPQDPKPEGTPPPASTAPEGGKPVEFPKWMDQLEGDLQKNEFLATHKTQSEVARKLVEFEGKRDRLVEIPGDGATDEIRGEFRKKLGIPAKVEDLKLNLPSLPSGAQWVEAELQEFNQFAVDAGLSVKQAQAALEFEAKRAIRGLQASEAQATARAKAARDADLAIEKELRKELGTSYDVSKTMAKENLNKIFSPAFVDALGKAGILDSAMAFKEMLALQARIGDTPFLRGNPEVARKGEIKGMEHVRAAVVRKPH